MRRSGPCSSRPARGRSADPIPMAFRGQDWPRRRVEAYSSYSLCGFALDGDESYGQADHDGDSPEDDPACEMIFKAPHSCTCALSEVVPEGTMAAAEESISAA